jgi:suppressor of ftsI/bilirubin oxidase
LFILKLNVKNKVAYDREIPTHLSDITPVSTAGATTRPFMLTGTRSQWLINGNSFSLNRIPVTVRKGATEIWEINNALNSMPHPMHLHGYQFQVLERINSPIRIRNLAVDGQGRLPTDKGWKDTVLVWPSETVRFVTNFADHFPGDQLFLFHCHILEHEDGGMMINYQVS